jgi:flagellar motor switch protein FliM
MSESFLSQEEVDALLEGVTGESQTSVEVAAEQGEVRTYNISSQERIVRGRMPTMEIVNERFARNLRVGLFNFIRRSPEISVGPVAVQRYSAFLRELAVPTNFNIVAIRPLRGSGLIVCEPALVFGVIDTLFGGIGKFPTRIEGRDFSATEQRVINRMVEVITEEYKKAWKGIYPLELEYQRSEMQPQFANVATPSEIVISTSFHLVFHPGAYSRRVVFVHPGRFHGSGPPLGQCFDSGNSGGGGHFGGRIGTGQCHGRAAHGDEKG